MTKQRITQQELKELLHYDPDTGIFRWLKKPGTEDSDGYRYIKIKGVKYSEHRLAWMYMEGVHPEGYVDHIDGIRNNNKWSNLRKATNQENQHNRGKQINNTSGFKGVTWYKPTGRWQAKTKVNQVTVNLGYYDTPEEAAEAYRTFARNNHGEFYRD